MEGNWRLFVFFLVCSTCFSSKVSSPFWRQVQYDASRTNRAPQKFSNPNSLFQHKEQKLSPHYLWKTSVPGYKSVRPLISSDEVFIRYGDDLTMLREYLSKSKPNPAIKSPFWLSLLKETKCGNSINPIRFQWHFRQTNKCFMYIQAYGIHMVSPLI